MNTPTNYIVFQCYGNESVFHECAFALLSLSRVYEGGVPAGLEIWIYTDNAAWFQRFKDCPLPLQFRKLEPQTIKAWRGKIDFVHRVKIEVLRDFTENRTGNVLYADTDVVFTNPVEPMMQAVESGRLYMHVMEGKISDEGNPVLKKLNDYLKSTRLKHTNGVLLNEFAMWNAGVLGFNTRFSAELDRILDFTDMIYPQFPKHVVEQFAFSVFFQAAGNVKSASPYLIHYWNLKEIRPLLTDFFTKFKYKTWKELTGYSALIQLPVLMQEKANFYQNRNIKGKLLKKKWTPAIPEWDEMMKQL